jgi:starvation-inducible DNA-binding protein
MLHQIVGHRYNGELTMTPQTQIAPARHRENRSYSANRSDIPVALTALLPDLFALYLKTQNLHWHVSGLQFGDCHLLLDDQAAQILATTDLIGERVRRLGGRTLTYIGHIGRLQNVEDSYLEEVEPRDKLAELLKDNWLLAKHMQATRALCNERGDVVTARLVENWIDEAEGRAWFLRDAAGPAAPVQPNLHYCRESVGRWPTPVGSP